MITLGRGICGQYEKASEREWLETNGRGSYAMGTICGANTRRHHSLLTLAVPGKNPFQTLNRVEESFFSEGTRIELSCQAYPNAIHPQGHQFLEEFHLDPYPTWTYLYGATRLEKSFFLRYGDDAAVILYKLFSGPPMTLEVRPLLTCRPHDEMVREDKRFQGAVSMSPHILKIAAPDAPPLFLCSTEGEFHADGFWYLNQEYERDRRQGRDYREDTYSPGAFRFDISPGQTVALVASVEERNSGDAAEWSRQERSMRRQIVEKALVHGPLAESLVSAADSFIVLKDAGARITTSYPWREEKPRGALIAFPGLCLATGRTREAAEILEDAARSIDKCLGASDAKSAPAGWDAEARLWYVWAAQAYFKATEDEALVRRLLPGLRGVVDAFQHGSRPGARMDEDGLIHLDPGAARRAGKPVEIQALWYNALQFLAELDIKFKEASRGYDKLAQVARTSFNEKYWNEARNYLFDSIDGKERDGALRPFALFAFSLPYEILEQKFFKPVAETAWKKLHVELGVRTLPADDPAFGRWDNGGGRAGAPQGAAWPSLLGPFITAFVKAFGASDTTKEEVQKFLRPFRNILNEHCLGFVAETFEGDPPSAPLGAPAEAASVGELLRVIWEEKLVL